MSWIAQTCKDEGQAIAHEGAMGTNSLRERFLGDIILRTVVACKGYTCGRAEDLAD